MSLNWELQRNGNLYGGPDLPDQLVRRNRTNSKPAILLHVYLYNSPHEVAQIMLVYVIHYCKQYLKSASTSRISRLAICGESMVLTPGYLGKTLPPKYISDAH